MKNTSSRVSSCSLASLLMNLCMFVQPDTSHHNRLLLLLCDSCAGGVLCPDSIPRNVFKIVFSLAGETCHFIELACRKSCVLVTITHLTKLRNKVLGFSYPKLLISLSLYNDIRSMFGVWLWVCEYQLANKCLGIHKWDYTWSVDRDWVMSL